MKRILLLIGISLFLLCMAACQSDGVTGSVSPSATNTAAATTATEGTSSANSSTTTETADPTSTPGATNWNFTKENFPRIDGSTANIPMAELMLKKLLKMTDKEIADSKMTVFATTPYAYDNLVNKTTDLLLVYEADETTKQRIEDSGVKLEYYPIGKDALVFIVNEINKVESLTEGQIQDIYQGKITNWKEITGKDIKMEAFQRPEKSGSQALIKKLVMGNKAMTNPPAKYYPAGMSDLIEVLAEYNNSGGAIGYSVYYYAENMYAKDGLKFIGVNGVMPSNETIANGSYPYTNDFFAVIRADEPEDSNTRRLLSWILSEEGKKVIKESGYVSTE